MANDRVDNGVIPLSHEFLSMMLGARRPGVTVVLGVFRRAGLISNARHNIAVLDLAGLRAATCECYRAVKDQYQRLLCDASPDHNGRSHLATGCRALRRFELGAHTLTRVDRDSVSKDPRRDARRPADGDRGFASPLEAKIFVRLRQGQTNSTIAEELGIRPGDLRRHVRTGLERFGATGVADLWATIDRLATRSNDGSR